METSVGELQKYVQASHLTNQQESSLTLKELGRLDKSYLTPQTTLYDAAKTMSGQNKTGLPVLDEAMKVVGFLSEKDCLRKLYERKLYQVSDGKIEDIMSKNVLCLEENSSIYHVIDIFIDNPFHVLPVTDSTGMYLGLVKRSDVFKFLL